MKNIQILILFLLCSSFAFAQVTPAPEQKGSILIINGTAHTGTGTMIENSAIAMENGKIVMVANLASIRIDKGAYDHVINAAGKHVYPGFIAPNSTLGLVEVGAVRSTRDNREVGEYNPNVRSIIAYNTDSDVIPTIRSNGVLMVEIAPSGGTIEGSSSIVQLDAWNWEDAAYKSDIGIHMNWPGFFSFSGFGSSRSIKQDEKYGEKVQNIRNYFMEASAYAKTEPATANLRFEAMEGLFSKEKKLFIHVNYARTILDAINFIKEFGLDAVIVGGRDSWLVAEELKSNNIPVILSGVQELPSRQDEDVDLPFKLPGILHQKGVRFAIGLDGGWEQRNLPFQAGQAVSYGLPYEEAVKAVTANTAEILGISDQVGTIEKGKDATLFISSGDVFDMRTSKVEKAFIQGREIDLDNKQKALYRQFSDKYSQK